MDWMALFGIVVALLMVSFFSGVEMAFVSGNKLSIELRKKQGTYSGAPGANTLIARRFIGTVLLWLLT
jgi:Mg2+/Co2+ transporter CorB